MACCRTLSQNSSTSQVSVKERCGASWPPFAMPGDGRSSSPLCAVKQNVPIRLLRLPALAFSPSRGTAHQCATLLLLPSINRTTRPFGLLRIPHTAEDILQIEGGRHKFKSTAVQHYMALQSNQACPGRSQHVANHNAGVLR